MTKKKSLAEIAMSYGYVYVAQVAMGANPAQTLKAIHEAEAYDGPSLIIGYSPCEMHSIKGGMMNCQKEMKKAVDCGYWNLFRFNPAAEKKFTLDSKAPAGGYHDFLMNEARYSRLTREFPDRAENLFARNEAEAKAELGEMDQTVWEKTIRPLRERSGVNGAMPATADPYLASYYDGVTDKWILECRRERSIELYMENTRRNDLMRWRMGHKLTVELAGIYIPELGKPFDMNGDGKNDLCFYSKSHPKSGSNQAGVSYVEVTAEEGDNVTTYGVNKDNCLVYILDREWADYKYLYPVPKNAIDINPNLRPQNPGWDD